MRQTSFLDGLDGRGGLGGDVVGHAHHPRDLGGHAGSDPLEDVVVEPGGGGRLYMSSGRPSAVTTEESTPPERALAANPSPTAADRARCPLPQNDISFNPFEHSIQCGRVFRPPFLDKRGKVIRHINYNNNEMEEDLPKIAQTGTLYA